MHVSLSQMLEALAPMVRGFTSGEKTLVLTRREDSEQKTTWTLAAVEAQPHTRNRPRSRK